MCPDSPSYGGKSIFLVIFSSDGGQTKAAEETESDADTELLSQSSSTGSPQPGQQTDPGSGDSEAGASQPGLCTQLMQKLD